MTQTDKIATVSAYGFYGQCLRMTKGYTFTVVAPYLLVMAHVSGSAHANICLTYIKITRLLVQRMSLLTLTLLHAKPLLTLFRCLCCHNSTAEQSAV
jgi:hypothetical protein